MGAIEDYLDECRCDYVVYATIMSQVLLALIKIVF